MQVASLFLSHGVRTRYATVKGVYTPKIHLLYASGSWAVLYAEIVALHTHQEPL